MFGELLAPVDYNLPGVLHYLQAEWRRFERERNEWTIERAELKARIALLEGERRGTEKLKADMLKRVKMLEYALRQERRQYLESSIHQPPANVMDDKVEVDITGYPGPLYKSSHTNVPISFPVKTSIDTKYREKSRQILKTCLQEISYLTSLPSKLPLTYTLATSIQNRNGGLKPDTESSLNQQPSTTSISTTVQNLPPLSANNPSPPSPISTKLTISGNQPPIPSTVLKMDEAWTAAKSSSSTPLPPPPPPTPPAIDERLGEAPTHRGTIVKPHGDNEKPSQSIEEKYNISNENMQKVMKNANKGSRNNRPSSPELHESDLNYLDGGSRQKIYSDSSKIWRNKMQFKGHLDSVRAVAFHPSKMLLASGSDDGTVKLINLEQSKATTTKLSLHDDLDAQANYRGHNNIVTGVAISAEQDRVYSSSLDGTLRVWRLPPSHHSTFSPVDPSLYVTTLVGHADAIWDFKLLPGTTPLLASASADGTVKVWNTEEEQLQWSWDRPFGTKVAPTSLDFCRPDKLVASYTNGKIQLYDIETGKVIRAWTGTEEATQRAQINKVISHPSSPLILSGHEDRLIQGYDLNSGKTVYSMSAHLDGVTSLDMVVDSALVSGGHDTSIRLWDMKMNKACIQEISAHRKKGDEGVLDVQFHRTSPWMVSGGADGIVKIYQHGPFV